MRAIVQRVTHGSVTVEGQVVGAIDEPGLCVLLGVTHSDGPPQAVEMARKLANLRLLHEEKSVLDVGAPVLVISQFTVYGNAAKGRRPSWAAAAPGPHAEPLVQAVVGGLRELGLTVATGVFGARMQVGLVNDGPFTLILDVG